LQSGHLTELSWWSFSYETGQMLCPHDRTRG